MSAQAEKRLQQQAHLEPVEDKRFEVYRKPGRRITLFQDVMAGLIVALVAIPLGIGFAIASGLKPEQGIIAGALAGILGGLFGGSKYQVYGPTAAFIPLLSGIVARYDVPFLILASIMAGGLILLMGLFKLGDHFSKVPFSVTVGFTIGIALSITLGQLPDALGNLHPISFHTLEKIQQIGGLLTHPNLFTLLLAGLSFFIIRKCYKVSVFIPGPLIAILIALTLAQTVFPHNTTPLIVDKFGMISGDELFKITLPALGGRSIWTLVLPVFSIVFIASLESLLSARMADRLANNKALFNPNRELLGQGIVNAVVPLLNGFPCTGAFARTATSIKAGATSPAASIFQGCFILFLTLFFAGYIGLVPMACISGLLVYVAFNMVKIDEVRYVFKHGGLHTFLMFYTAIVTFLTDLLIAVSSATVLYYAITAFKKYRVGTLVVGLCILSLPISGFAEPMPDDSKAISLALSALIAGNQRFYRNQPLHIHQTHEQLLTVSKEQHPFMAILGCSDSRVPPEIIFDQGLGDVFDIRVAGNVLDPVVLGSLEYAVDHLHVPLIVVMGHERCGAIQAALDHEAPHNHINGIIRALAPIVREAGDSSEQAAKNNVRQVLAQIYSSPFFQRHLTAGRLKLIGAYYHLDSGRVEFLHAPKQQAHTNHRFRLQQGYGFSEPTTDSQVTSIYMQEFEE